MYLSGPYSSETVKTSQETQRQPGSAGGDQRIAGSDWLRGSGQRSRHSGPVHRWRRDQVAMATRLTEKPLGCSL